MTATLTEVGVTPYAVVADAWQVYRRSQDVRSPAVGAGNLMAAQSRLFVLAEPFASGRRAAGEADLGAIEDAVDALVATVEWHSGAGMAAYVSSDGRDAA